MADPSTILKPYAPGVSGAGQAKAEMSRAAPDEAGVARAACCLPKSALVTQDARISVRAPAVFGRA